MSLEQNLHRGSRAKEVLENEVFIEAFEAIEQELTESWKKSPARDQSGRESLWQLQMLWLWSVETHTRRRRVCYSVDSPYWRLVGVTLRSVETVHRDGPQIP